MFSDWTGINNLGLHILFAISCYLYFLYRLSAHFISRNIFICNKNSTWTSVKRDLLSNINLKSPEAAGIQAWLNPALDLYCLLGYYFSFSLDFAYFCGTILKLVFPIVINQSSSCSTKIPRIFFFGSICVCDYFQYLESRLISTQAT